HAETFLKGRPLNVTDIAIGPDGAMYLVTGGRKTQSALYRIAYTGNDLEGRQFSPHEKACRSFSAAGKSLRVELEKLHRPAGQLAIDIAWPHLDSPDPTIRHAARIAVEHQPPELWRDKALADDRLMGGLTARMALARSGDRASVAAIIDRSSS